MNWRQGISAMRGLENMQLKEDLDRWDQASRQTILELHAGTYQQRTLFGTSELPPALKRRLRQHEERVRERRTFLDRRTRLDEPSIESLGVLLRVPVTVL